MWWKVFRLLLYVAVLYMCVSGLKFYLVLPFYTPNNRLIHVCKWIEVVTQIAFKRKDTRLIHVCKWIEVRYIHRLNRCVTVLYMCVSGLKLLLSSMSVSRLKSYTCV